MKKKLKFFKSSKKIKNLAKNPPNGGIPAKEKNSIKKIKAQYLFLIIKLFKLPIRIEIFEIFKKLKILLFAFNKILNILQTTVEDTK